MELNDKVYFGVHVRRSLIRTAVRCPAREAQPPWGSVDRQSLRFAALSSGDIGIHTWLLLPWVIVSRSQIDEVQIGRRLALVIQLLAAQEVVCSQGGFPRCALVVLAVNNIPGRVKGPH